MLLPGKDFRASATILSHAHGDGAQVHVADAGEDVVGRPAPGSG